MNCKPGDIAIVVNARPKNLGKFVRVVEPFGDVDFTHEGYGVLFCWTVESLSGLVDTPAGARTGGFIPGIGLRLLLRRGKGDEQPQQAPLEPGPCPPVVLARADLTTPWKPEPATIERHPLVTLLGLQTGVDFVPGRSTFTEAGEEKVAVAYTDPPSPGVASRFAEINQRDASAADWY